MMLGWLAAGIMAVPMSAQALVVTVGGQAYDVSVVNGTFNDLRSGLTTQPFWGNSTLAADLAGAVKGDLDFPNSLGLAGPYFAFNETRSRIPIQFWVWSSAGLGQYSLQSGEEMADRETFDWAIARRQATPT